MRDFRRPTLIYGCLTSILLQQEPDTFCQYRKHEEKKAHDQIREVELVFLYTCFAEECNLLLQTAGLHACPYRDQPYSTTLWWLRCHLTFSLICSAIQVLCKAISSVGHAIHSSASVHLVIAESSIPLTHSFSFSFIFVLMFAYMKIIFSDLMQGNETVSGQMCILYTLLLKCIYKLCTLH